MTKQQATEFQAKATVRSAPILKSVIGLVCLLSACQSNHLPGEPEKAANFPAMVADLSDCVYRSAQALRSPYLFHRLQVRAEKEFLVTATGPNAPMAPKLFPKLELRFITQGETTTVEMRDNAIQDHELSDDVWAIVDRCSQQMTKAARSKID